MTPAAKRAARRTADLLRDGRHPEAWDLLADLPFGEAVNVAERLHAAAWTPPDSDADVFARLREASGAPAPTARPGRPDVLEVEASVTALSFAPDTGRLAVGTGAHGLQVWDLRSMRAVARYDAPQRGRDEPGGAQIPVKHVLHLREDRILLAAATSLVDPRDLYLAEGPRLRHLAGFGTNIAALLRLPGPDDAALVVGGSGETWTLSSTGALRRSRDLEGSASALWGAAISADGTKLATYNSAVAALHDFPSGRRLARTETLPPLSYGDTVKVTSKLPLTMPAGQLGSVAVQPDGDGLVAGTADGAVRLLDLRFGHRGELRRHRRVPQLATAGRTLVTAKSGVLHVYRWPGTDPVELRPGTDSPHGALALSEGGCLVAVDPDARTVRKHPDRSEITLWNLTSWALAPLLDVTPNEAAPADLALAAEASRLAENDVLPRALTTFLNHNPHSTP
ncbi:MAG TPA: hypothetical protein VFV01_36160 [Spirillospora sp.]|nr:hypothetical protein [Spirillospora sp.]